MKLIECNTEHPGGWEDIIEYVGDRKISVGVASYNVVYHVEATGKDMKGRKIVEARREYKSSFSVLGDIEGDISGRVAAVGWEWLRLGGYPLPGDDKWLKPCSEW